MGHFSAESGSSGLPHPEKFGRMQAWRGSGAAEPRDELPPSHPWSPAPLNWQPIAVLGAPSPKIVVTEPPRTGSDRRWTGRAASALNSTLMT